MKVSLFFRFLEFTRCLRLFGFLTALCVFFSIKLRKYASTIRFSGIPASSSSTRFGYWKNVILQRKFGVYELDTSITIDFLVAHYRPILFLEVGAAYGYFTEQILRSMASLPDPQVKRYVVSVEPDTDLVQLHLSRLASLPNVEFSILNDFLSSVLQLNQPNIEKFFRKINDIQAVSLSTKYPTICFIDADNPYQGLWETLNDIMTTLEKANPFSIYIIEFTHSSPEADSLKFQNYLVSWCNREYILYRMSRKRYVFLDPSIVTC